MDRYTFQAWVSLVNTLWVVGINLYEGWGSEIAMRACIVPVLVYNVFDLIIGGEQYYKRDQLTILHHFGAIGGMLYFRSVLQESYPDPLYIFTWWMLFGEISSIFNNVRVICGKTSYKDFSSKLFAIIFIPSRTLMTCGTIYSLQNFEHKTTPVIIAGIFAFLNIYWGIAIVKKVFKSYKKD